MPSRPSAKKRLRQNEAHRLRNRTIRSDVRTQIRKVRAAIAAEDVETSETEFRVAVKKLDQTAAKSIIHKNTASRTKARLSAAIKAIKAG